MNCPTHGKVCYLNKAEAQGAARQSKQLRGVTLNVYQCPCGYWHLTRLSNAARKNKLRQKERQQA
jgi:hypothetical protein